jgi:4-hydroxymandelate oxidase
MAERADTPSAAALMRSAWKPDDLERAAEQVLPDDVYAFVAAGADDEVAVRRNRTAFESYAFIPHVLARSSAPDPAVEVLGCRLRAPLIVAPMGMQRMVHPDGELATAAAARSAGVGFTLASGSSVAMEEVAGVAGADRWFQLYLLTDRAVSRDLVQRAIACGYRAIVLTVDVPVVGHRPRDQRDPHQPPPGGVRNANFEPYETINTGNHAYVSGIDSDIGWEDLAWLVDIAGEVPVVVKGILRVDDARRAIDHGAAGIVVSNHGGRQLGRAAATIDVLPGIVDAVRGSAAVLLDGGVRSASDVLTAIALGADAVLVGRLVMWALAVGGEEGVTTVLTGLVEQIRRTMILLGARSVADLPGLVQA